MTARLALAFCSLALCAAAAQPPDRLPDLQAGALATGPYSRLHMRLERTIFSVDVLTVEVRVDAATERRFRELASGQSYSSRLAEPIAQAAVEAQQVYVALEFERHVSLGRWMREVRAALEKAWRSGLIEEQEARHVSDSLPQWFAAIADRGFRDGDRILYRGYPDAMRTVLVSHDGRVLLDQTDPGAAPRRTMLAGYFAPGTDFREPLIRSLFAP